VPRPRTPQQLLETAFLATRRRLEELIHPPRATVEDRLPMIRMTHVEDDVL
jgi:NitT/TauT family transport system ATP-binding protein